MLLDFILLALKRIKSRLLESIIVIISLGVGLAIVITLLGVVFSFNDNMGELQNSPWRRQIFINIDQGLSPYQIDSVAKSDFQYEHEAIATGNPANFPDSILPEMKRDCPSIIYTVVEDWYMLSSNGFREDDEKWWETPSCYGVNSDFFGFNEHEIESGTLFTQDDYDNANNVLILAGGIKNRLFPDSDPVGEILTYDNKDYKIIGVLKENYQTKNAKEIEEMKNNRWSDVNQVFVPYTLNEFFNASKGHSRLRVGVESYENLDAAESELRDFMELNYPEIKFEIDNPTSWDEDNDKTTKQVLLAMGTIALICLIIAALTNLNLMLARVLRDKKGLGISIALGSSKRKLFSNVILESSIMGFLGAVLAIILTTLFTAAVTIIMQEGGMMMGALINYKTIISTIILAILLTALFSIFPALEASRVSPSQVLRED